MKKWNEFVEEVREKYGIKKTKKYEPIILDYTNAELEILRCGEKISRIPKIKK